MPTKFDKAESYLILEYGSTDAAINARFDMDEDHKDCHIIEFFLAESAKRK